MRCRLCELFMDQLQPLNLSSFHGSSSSASQLHQYHQHAAAVPSSALFLPQMRDMIVACLTRGRDTYFLLLWCLKELYQQFPSLSSVRGAPGKHIQLVCMEYYAIV
jgi:hypothetical protein